MPLVGDVLMGCREAMVDLPGGTLNAPGSEVTAAQVATACTLQPASYFVKLAYRTGGTQFGSAPWGETTPGTEIGPLAVDATHGIQITGTLPLGVSEVVAYIGTASNAESFAFSSTTLPFTISSNTGGYSDVPSTRNTAYMPDSDGRSLSAFALYRWLNDGLEQGAALCGGGMPDISGVASVAGQGIYTLTGNWWKLDKAWYDGYPMGVMGQDAIFRKNKVPGNYSMALVVSHVDERVIVESWPQPSRTAGVVTLNGALGAGTTGTITTVAGASSYVLPMGLAILGPDSFNNTEIVYYSAISGGNSMTIAIRGLGGTIARSWAANTPVTELNLSFHGLRIPPRYKIGSALATLNVPPGWKPALDHYLLHRFRMLEKDDKRAQQEYAQFKQIIEDAPMNKPVGGPRQIQVGGNRGSETFPGLGGVFGGVLVP